jgi:hypothetical protein
MQAVLAPEEPRGNKLQSVEREVGIDGFDELGFLTDQGRLTTGTNDSRVGTQLLFQANDDSVHQSDISVKETALHACYGRRPDDLCGLLNFNSRQLGCMLVQSFRGNHNAWCDQAAAILACRRNGIKRCRSSEIHDDCRLSVFTNSGNSIHNTVRPNLSRIVI